jgi:exportin-T
MEVSDQTRILTLVIAPHVQYIEKVLGSPDLQRDPDQFGSILSSSIAAIAFLSKGFEKRPAIEVQLILSGTLHVAYTVLGALARNAPVRNKTMIFLQRMILCLNQKVLPPMPGFLDLLISNCTADDILDVSQLLLQLCIKFKEDAAPAIDAAVLPFLRQCHTLMPSLQEVVGHKEGDPIPPHLMTEQLSIKKMSYSFLQHVVTYRVTAVLVSPTNSSRIVDVLQSMNQGATEVHDPVVKKACVIFFRDLMDQWCDNSSNPNEDAIRKGCIQFVWETFLPGMLSCFLNSSFNERDAIQSRVIVEVANVLHVLKSKRGGDEFEQCFITSRLGAMQAPRNVVDGFRSASNEKDIEECLKGLLTEMKRA